MLSRHRVAPADSTWLTVDSPNNPMMISGVLWFATPVAYDTVLQVLQERLVDRFPKFAARVVRDGSGKPWWEPDPVFDVAAHLHRVALPAPGGKAGLEQYVAQVMTCRLDPERALWHAELVEDFEGGSALIIRLHHVIADGISLARVLLQLADAESTQPRDRKRRGALGTASKMLRRVLGEQGLFDGARWLKLARLGTASAAEMGSLVTMAPDRAEGLRGELGIRKVAAWMSPLPLARVKAVGKACGATVNDVLLCALAAAISAQLEARGKPADEVRTFVPVNLRPLDRPIPRDLGNQFGLVVLGLPLAPMSPLQRLAEMKQRMDAIKASPQALLAYGLLQGLAQAPDTIEQSVASFFADKASLITTNVPGPREHLFIAGHRVDGIMCWVPQASGVGLGVSILSYAGDVRVGVACDAGVLGDATSWVEAYASAFAALERAVV